MIETQRLRLRPWRSDDRDAFAALLADPEVMADYGGALDRAASDRKFDYYRAVFDQHGLCRWAVETRDGVVRGYVGVMPADSDHPLGPHFDVGWRLMRSAWGHGYATEAARASLHDAFTRTDLSEIFAYTKPDHLRSQAVMSRLHLQRRSDLDFAKHYPEIGDWHAWVWAAQKAAFFG